MTLYEFPNVFITFLNEMYGWICVEFYFFISVQNGWITACCYATDRWNSRFWS